MQICARSTRMWTGVYHGPPHRPQCPKLDEITYDEMLELASQGAQVLHNRSVELAKKFRVNLEVVSSLSASPARKSRRSPKWRKPISPVSPSDTSIARVALIGLQHNPGVAFQVFDLLSKAQHQRGCHPAVHWPGRTPRTSPSRSTRRTWRRPSRFWRNIKETLRFDHIETDESIGKVSIVGAGLMSNCGVAARMFEALYEAGINIQMINTSEIRVSVLLDEEDVNRAVGPSTTSSSARSDSAWSISPAGRAHRRALCFFRSAPPPRCTPVERGEANHEDPSIVFALRYLAAAVVCGLALLLLHSTAQAGLPAAFVPQCPSPWELSKLAFWPLLAAWVLTGRLGRGAPHAAARSAGSGAGPWA